MNGKVSTTTSWAILAKTIRDNSIQTKNASLSGTISNLTTNSFTLTGKNKTLQVTTDTTTKFKVDGQTAAFTNLTNGMTAQVSGIWDRTLSTIMANKVNAHTAKE